MTDWWSLTQTHTQTQEVLPHPIWFYQTASLLYNPFILRSLTPQAVRFSFGSEPVFAVKQHKAANSVRKSAPLPRFGSYPRLHRSLPRCERFGLASRQQFEFLSGGGREGGICVCVCGKSGIETPQISVTFDTFLHERKRQEHHLVLHCGRLSRQKVTTELWVRFVSQYQSKHIESKHGQVLRYVFRSKTGTACRYCSVLQNFSPLNDS